MPAGYPVDLTGRQIGDWLVLERLPNSKTGQVRYLCECVRGARRPVQASNMQSGNSKRCKSCAQTREHSPRWNKNT